MTSELQDVTGTVRASLMSLVISGNMSPLVTLNEVDDIIKSLEAHSLLFCYINAHILVQGCPCLIQIIPMKLDDAFTVLLPSDKIVHIMHVFKN